jgi:hypothetical protein
MTASAYKYMLVCAGILKQSMRARKWVVVPARHATFAGGIDSVESIPGLLKS